MLFEPVLDSSGVYSYADCIAGVPETIFNYDVVVSHSWLTLFCLCSYVFVLPKVWNDISLLSSDKILSPIVVDKLCN